MKWTIADAKTGVVEQGEISFANAKDRQPYPTNTADYVRSTA